VSKYIDPDPFAGVGNLIVPGTNEQDSEYASVLTSILDASTMYSIVATQLDGTFVLWNEGARRTYGYTADEVIGQNIRILYSEPDVRSGVVDQMFAVALERGQWEGVADRVRKGGAQFPTRIVLTVRRDASGVPIGFLSVTKDISEENRLSERLRASEAYSRGLVESAIDGILTTDLDGRILDINKEMEHLSGRARDAIVGQRLRDLTSPPAAGDAAVHRLLEEGRARNLELRLLRPDGETVDISLSGTLRSEIVGHPVGLVAVVRDVSQDKRLREQLELRNRELVIQNERVREASRMKSEFLANMSHELRTPLNSIIGFSDFMLTDADQRLNDDQREYLTDILNSGNHLLSLINDILDLSRVESGKLDLHPESFSLPDAVDAVCSTLRPQLQTFELALRTEVSAEVEWVVLDQVRFKQILYNLLSNAVKFTPKGGHVAVAVAPTGPTRFQMSVQDSGIGIPARDLSRIFREFEQLDSGTNRKYPGTGLGLPVTQKLVNLLGGSINVHSEVGKGSTFTVHLPLVRPGPSEAPAPRPEVRA
jgi:PAS domain S-box-containing protein